MIEQTLSIIKPDAVERDLVGKIQQKFSNKKLKIVKSKKIQISKEEAAEFYKVHQTKPFYEKLCAYLSSGPIVVMVLEGKNAVSIVRQMMGSTDPSESPPGTIRGDFGIDLGRNVIHGSDTNPGSNEREINLFFDELEFSSYERIDETWLYE